VDHLILPALATDPYAFVAYRAVEAGPRIIEISVTNPVGDLHGFDPTPWTIYAGASPGALVAVGSGPIDNGFLDSDPVTLPGTQFCVEARRAGKRRSGLLTVTLLP
jgi:hypothetical protein